MGWAKSMPDEAFKTMIVGGLVLALAAAALLEFRSEDLQRVRRPAHAAVCIGGLLLGVGLLIAMLREESKLSHGAIAVFVVGVVLTTVSYVVWAISTRRGFGVAAAALLLTTVLSAAAVGMSFDNESCGCGNPGPPSSTLTD